MHMGSLPRQRRLGCTHVNSSAVPCIRLGSAVSRRPCRRSRHLATFASDGHWARESLTNSSSSSGSSSAGQQSSQPAAAAVSSGSSAQHNPATSRRPDGSNSSHQPVSSRDWDFWCEHFELQDLAGSRQDALQPLLAAAVAEENYRSAAAIRSEINDLIAADAVAAVQQQLAAAVAAEQYDLAAVLRDQAWAVLQGWWVCANPADEGHLLRVMPEYGRWTGQKYTPTDLVQLQAGRKRHQKSSSSNSSSSKLQAVADQDNMRNLGTPVLEIFVKQQQQNGDNSAAVATAAPWISQAVQLRSTLGKDVTAAPTSSGNGDVSIDQVMQNLFKSNAVSLGRSPLADDTAAAAAAGLAAPGSPRTSDMYAAGASVGASFDDDSSQDDALQTGDSAEDDVMQSGDYSLEVPDSTPISDQVTEYASTYSRWVPYLDQSNGSMISIHNTFNDAILDAAESTLTAAAAAADAAGGVLCADGDIRPISRHSAAAAACDNDHAPAAAVAPRLQLVVHVIESHSCVTLVARAISGGTVITRDLETSEIMPPGPRMVPDWSLVVPEQVPGLRARLAASLEAQRLVREMLGGKDGWWKTQLIGTVAPTAAAAATGDQPQQQQQQQPPRDKDQQHGYMTWLLPLQLAHLQQQQRQDQQQQQWQEQQQQQQQDDVTGDLVQSAAVSAADVSGFYPDFYHDFAPDYEGLAWQEVLSLIYKQQQQQQEKEEAVSDSSTSSSSSPRDQFLLNPQYANLSPQEVEEIHETLEQLKLGSAAAAAASSYQQQHLQQQQQEDQESKAVWAPPGVINTQQQQQQQQLTPVVEQQQQQQQQQQPRGLTRKRPCLNSIGSSSSSRSRAEAAWESAVAAGMVQTMSSSYRSTSGDAFEMLFSSELERSPATVTMIGKDMFVMGPDPATHSGSSMAQQQQQSDTAGSSSSKLQDRVFVVEVPVTISDTDQLQQQQQQQQSGAASSSSSSQGYSRVWQLAAHQVLVQHACSILHQQPSSSSSSSSFAESSASCAGGESLCLPLMWRQPLADLMAVRAQSVLGDIAGALNKKSEYHGSSSSSDVGAVTSSSSSSPVLSISDDTPLLVVEIPPELVQQAVAARDAAAVDHTAAAAAAANAPSSSSSSSSSDQQGGGCTVPDGVVYRRINGVNTHQSDPLTGLFLGAFGPHGPEVIQVQRSVCLNTGAEQVVGVKLTGDDNVPAGEVTFRAKVGHRHKLSTKGMFAQQLDIVARYPGEGRAARPGFTNPRWVPGELLVFNNSSSRTDDSPESWIADAQLGFVFDIPGHRRFCVLLNRVTLP